MDISPISESLEKVGKAALEEIPGCDAVSVTLVDHESISTTFATDHDTREVDQVQYSNGTGPCVDAMRNGIVVRTDELATEDRWPEYAAAARDLGFTAVLAAPLRLDDVSVGALNLYSRSAPSFDPELEPAVKAIASQASVAIDYAKLYEQAAVTVAQLEEALKSRAVIDQAIGVLMEREAVGERDAFEMLKTASQHANVKLREVARRIVDGNGSD